MVQETDIKKTGQHFFVVLNRDQSVRVRKIGQILGRRGEQVYKRVNFLFPFQIVDNTLVSEKFKYREKAHDLNVGGKKSEEKNTLETFREKCEG